MTNVTVVYALDPDPAAYGLDIYTSYDPEGDAERLFEIAERELAKFAATLGVGFELSTKFNDKSRVEPSSWETEKEEQELIDEFGQYWERNWLDWIPLAAHNASPVVTA